VDINQFQPFTLKHKKGAICEHYLVSERFKYLPNHQINSNSYFCRSFAQQEIDYIEERNGEIQAFEFKFNFTKTTRFLKTFLNAYPQTTQTRVITPDIYLEFLFP
jgi:hypothetical protein